MVNVAGSVTSGPFLQNTDSACADTTYTPMMAGTDGGLRTGTYQPQPDPPFDKGGNGAAAKITRPTRWYGVAYALATNEKDPQTGQQAAAPAIYADGARLSGNLGALGVAWNGQHFNRGAPRPDGSKPGKTIVPSGTYDPASKAFTLEWTSQIVGGPFNDFTGTWHLEGTFRPK